MNQIPRPLAITMGDPAGIGPETIIKSLTEVGVDTTCVVIGDAEVLRRAARAVGADVTIHTIRTVDEAIFRAGNVDVLETSSFTRLPDFGKADAAAGQAAYDAIVSAIRLAADGQISGIVTAPINKAALAMAGIDFQGHTEILAHFGGAERVAMMLANDVLRTVLVTIHCSLSAAIRGADFDAQMSAIRLAHQGARDFGIARPRVAVAGLNPHAGEGGLFGREEITIITPAIQAARDEGINASGPWPGDTVFMQARQGLFDVVVAQYHDQGLIPIKYLGLENGVNITLGLPFVRTSPDHGTAFDIAGQGTADPSSLISALALARQLVRARQGSVD